MGCGTGALCAAILDRCSPSSVTSVEPSEGFLRTATEKLAGRATFRPGSATAIPLGHASVDVVVSGLVLNFVPDRRAALAEMARVTVKDGTIAAYVWDYAGKMELLRYYDVTNFHDYWPPFLGGHGPALSYAMSLDETARARLRDRIRERILIAANGSISLTVRAWAIRAILAK